MSLAFAIMDSPEKNILNSDFISYYYGLWRISEPIDMGGATENALRNFKIKEYKLLDNNYNYFNKVRGKIINDNYETLANGFLMRKSVFYVWIFYRYNQKIKTAFENAKNDNLEDLYNLFLIIKDLSKIDDECTHPNPECSSATAYITLITLGFLCNIEPYQIINYIINMITFIINDKNTIEIDINLGKFIQEYIDKFSNRRFDFWDFFTSKDDNVYDNMGWYKHSLRLILYFVINFGKLEREEEKKDIFRYIVDNICNIGGDTDTNAAIVGGVIGPLIGYKNFQVELDVMLKKGRKVYYPIFMMLYLDFLIKSNKKRSAYNKKNFIKMIVTIMYGKIDENKLFI